MLSYFFEEIMGPSSSLTVYCIKYVLFAVAVSFWTANIYSIYEEDRHGKSTKKR